MKLTGWTWLICGGIISILSGYVYLFIPKNGEKNMAMAFFFFIGILFIVIGIAKLFFRRMDDKSVMDSIKTEQPQPRIVTMPQMQDMESKPNLVDETISQMMQQEQSQTQKPVVPKNVSINHSNTFSKMYEYKGPVHTPSSGTHAGHPVSQHIQSPNTSTQAVHTQHPIHNTNEHSIKCKRCGNANPGSSNYCHQCGNRLK